MWDFAEWVIYLLVGGWLVNGALWFTGGPLASAPEGTYPVQTEGCGGSALAYGDGGTALLRAEELHQ